MSIANDFRSVLVLAAHTDDGELGCGATIARFVEEGREVHYAAMSTCDASLPPEFAPNALAEELQEAVQVLGLPLENLIVYDYEVRRLAEHRQEILEQLVLLSRDIDPDLVILPSRSDLHQDHQTVCMEGMRAFKRSSILGYEHPWNHISFPTLAFVVAEEQQVQSKLQALECYRTQAGRPYMDPDFVRSLARTRGTQIQVKYAEAFEIMRWIVR